MQLTNLYVRESFAMRLLYFWPGYQEREVLFNETSHGQVEQLLTGKTMQIITLLLDENAVANSTVLQFDRIKKSETN